MKKLRILIVASIFLMTGTLVFAANKTPFFSKRQAGGGIVISDQTQTTGNIWFVDSGASGATDGAGYGQNPESPCATLDYCIGLATANNGDVIVVMPGHAESYEAADGFDADRHFSGCYWGSGRGSW